MNNIKIIKTGINVNKILNQLKQYPEDWNTQTNLSNSDSMLNYGFPEVSAGVLQLIIGGVANLSEYVGDTEYCIKTPFYNKYYEMSNWLKRNFPTHSRCGFLSLPVGGIVGKHIDIGSYYLTRDRYHLCIQGQYRYTVEDESVIVNAGDLLVFNNKLNHSAENIGDNVRITFVFDVPYKNDKSLYF